MANLRADNLTGTGGRNAMNGSVYFSGHTDGYGGDFLMAPDVDDYDVGTGDFTVEAWIKPIKHGGTNDPNYMAWFGAATYSTDMMQIQVKNDGKIRVVNNGTIDQTGTSVLWGSWHHIEVSRSGSTLKIFVNGIQEVSHTYSSAIDFAHGQGLVIGQSAVNNYPGDYNFKGYISNLRMLKGTALHTSNFTPSTEKLSIIENTVLLCCQDPDDPTTEATGKDLIGYSELYRGKRYSNIATNGDFETGDTTGWTNNGCVTFGLDNNSHSGSYSLHCVSDGNGDGVSYSVALNTMHRYKISAYLKCVGPAGTSAKAKMKVGDAFGGSGNYESQTVGYDSYKTFDKWEYVEWIGKATYATTIISFVESSANATNEWYVDDLRVELWYPEETENLLANPNFLTGATGWSFSSTPSGEHTISDNRLNVADTSRTSDAFATQQIHFSNADRGRYRITADYAFATGGFDAGIGGNRIWTIQGTASNTWELESGTGNVNFRLITGQTGAGYYNSVHLYRIEPRKQTNNELPSVGVDEGVTFEGDIKMNSQGYMYFPTGDTEQRGRGRGLVGGGNNPGQSNVIQYVEMRTSGNATDFGDLTALTQDGPGATASATRGVWGGGQVFPANSNIVSYVTIATTAHAIDFGDLTVARRATVATGNQTRGVWGGGQTPTLQDVIDYVTIATTANAIDFGNLTDARCHAGSASSPTRALFAGGLDPSNSDIIDYITIATTGNATDFGNLTTAKQQNDGVSNNTRAVFFAGQISPARVNTIEYVTIASTGNATDFGDLTQKVSTTQPMSNSIRGLRAGGYDADASAVTNTIGFITIATTGNELDFGDLYIIQAEGAGCSDSHGGLS